MKKLLAALLSTVLLASFVACGGNGSSTSPAAGGSDTGTGTAASEGGGEATGDGNGASIMHVVTGNLGDGALSDIAHAGMVKYVNEFGGTLNQVELAYDASLYESTIYDVCRSGEYDIIAVGFYNLQEALEAAAVDFPDQKFLAFDVEVDYSDGKFPNVKSVQAKQNEGAFLAGALAALMTTHDEVDGINDQKKVGYVGAAENTAILDFLVGYIDGVNYVDSDVEVLYSFVGNWTDTAVAKELALSQYQQGADISFSVCGTAGLGVADAAKEANAYHIGVDWDMAESIKDNNYETAQHIMTSCVKDLTVLVYDLLVDYENGTLEWGTHTIAGVAEGGMKLADNEFYQAAVPAEVQAELQQIIDDLSAGKIEVRTAIGAEQSEIDSIKGEAAPF